MGNAISAASLSAYFAALLVLLLLGLVLFRVFNAPIKFLATLFINSVAGGVLLLMSSFVLGFFGIELAVSVFSAVVIGLLGLPGFVLILILNFIL